MKSTWSTGASTVTETVQLIATALSPASRHVCDPDGFYCDCARRATINAQANGRRRWLDRRPDGWLRRDTR